MPETCVRTHKGGTINAATNPSWGNIHAEGQLSATASATNPATGDTIQIIRVAGFFERLYLSIFANTWSTDGSLAFVTNAQTGALGTQTVTLTAGSATEFEDTLNKDTVASGDQNQTKLTPSAGTGAVSRGALGMAFVAANGTTGCFVGSEDTAISVGNTRYMQYPNCSNVSASESGNQDMMSCVTGTFKFAVLGALGNTISSGATSIKLRFNSTTDGTVEISSSSGSGVLMESGGSQVDATVDGDKVKRKLVGAAVGNSNGLHVVWLETLDASQQKSVQNAGLTYAKNVTSYDPVTGNLQALATESNVQAKAGVPQMWDRGSLYVTTVTGGTQITVTSRINGAAGTQSIVTTTTGWTRDTTHIDPMVQSDEINWRMVTNNTGTSLVLASLNSRMSGLPSLFGSVIPRPDGAQGAWGQIAGL